MRHLAIREKIGVEVDGFDRRRSGWIGRRGHPDTCDGAHPRNGFVVGVADVNLTTSSTSPYGTISI